MSAECEASLGGSQKRRARVVAAGESGVALAAEILRAGGLVALPTETVYGLAADAGNAEAVAGIFAVKGRPDFNPLICHVTGREAAGELAEIPPTGEALMRAFWPGPLTLVLPKRAGAPLADPVTAGLATVAVRAPAHTLARQLLFAVERPLAAPSANRSGRVSPTTAAHVAEDLEGEIDLILDGGACGVGLESTVLGVGESGLSLLRAGAITAQDVADATGLRPQTPAADGISAPGQLTNHYAPNAPVRLNATAKRAGEVFIGFGSVAGDVTLSARGDLVEAAANLFARLREADRMGAAAIAVAPIPEHGIGAAINDRLVRAAGAGDSEGEEP